MPVQTARRSTPRMRRCRAHPHRAATDAPLRGGSRGRPRPRTATRRTVRRGARRSCQGSTRALRARSRIRAPSARGEMVAVGGVHGAARMGSGADLPFARVLGREPPCCRKVDGAHHEWAHVQPRCVLKRDRRAVQPQSEPWRPKLRPERREPRARSTHAKPAPPLPVAYALRAETRPRLRAAAEQPERGESGEGGESVGEPAPARRRQVVVLHSPRACSADCTPVSREYSESAAL